jgi:putative transposase
LVDVPKNQQEAHHIETEIQEDLLGELLRGYYCPEDLLGPDGLFIELKKRLINRVLDAELTTHLG